MNSGSQKVAAWRTLGWIVESTKHWTVAMGAISSIKLITSLLTMTIPKLSLIFLFTCLLQLLFEEMQSKINRPIMGISQSFTLLKTLSLSQSAESTWSSFLIPFFVVVFSCCVHKTQFIQICLSQVGNTLQPTPPRSVIQVITKKKVKSGKSKSHERFFFLTYFVFLGQRACCFKHSELNINVSVLTVQVLHITIDKISSVLFKYNIS